MSKYMVKDMRFLVVDDLVMNRILLCEILKIMGASYDVASNGKEAILKLKEHDFDIILMDIEMPVMNGIEATRYIKSEPKYAGIKIVGVTAHDPRRFRKDFENVTFDGFVTKPYSIERLQDAFNKF